MLFKTGKTGTVSTRHYHTSLGCAIGFARSGFSEMLFGNSPENNRAAAEKWRAFQDVFPLWNAVDSRNTGKVNALRLDKFYNHPKGYSQEEEAELLYVKSDQPEASFAEIAAKFTTKRNGGALNYKWNTLSRGCAYPPTRAPPLPDELPEELSILPPVGQVLQQTIHQPGMPGSSAGGLLAPIRGRPSEEPKLEAMHPDYLIDNAGPSDSMGNKPVRRG